MLRDGTVFLKRPDAFVVYAQNKNVSVKKLENQFCRAGKHRAHAGVTHFRVVASDGQEAWGFVLKNKKELFPHGSPGISEVFDQVV